MSEERRRKVLNAIVHHFIKTAEPVGSNTMLVSYHFHVSPATIRNDMMALEEEKYIFQPHTSAGRVPTKKAYKHFADKITDSSRYFATSQCCKISIVRQIKTTREEIGQEMRQMQEIMQTLENDNLFEILTTIEIWHKKNQN